MRAFLTPPGVAPAGGESPAMYWPAGPLNRGRDGESGLELTMLGGAVEGVEAGDVGEVTATAHIRLKGRAVVAATAHRILAVPGDREWTGCYDKLSGPRAVFWNRP